MSLEDIARKMISAETERNSVDEQAKQALLGKIEEELLEALKHYGINTNDLGLDDFEQTVLDEEDQNPTIKEITAANEDVNGQMVKAIVTKLSSIAESKKNSRNGDFNNTIHARIGDSIMDAHDFVRIDDSLYYYVSAYGYWRFVGPLSNSSPYIRLRQLVPKSYKRYITERNITDVYGYILDGAEEIDSRNLRDRRNYINLRDCEINIDTSETITDRQNLYFQFYLDTDYDKCFAEKPDDALYNYYVKNLFGSDKKTLKSFESMLGLIISNIRNLKTSFILYGRSNTGKTTLLDILSGLFPRELVSAVPFSRMDKEFTVSMLNGAVLNTSEDIIVPNIECVSNFNSSTGNGTIVASKKGKDPVNFKCQAIFVTACSSLPKIPASYMETYLNRVIVFPFTNVFSDRKNFNIADDLLSNKEVLIKAGIEGLKRLKKNGFEIKESLAMEICRQELLGENNSFLLFARNYIRLNPEGSISSRGLYAVYTRFCDIHNFTIMSQKACAQVMRESYGAKPSHITSGEEIENGCIKYNSRGFKGVELYNTDELSEDEEYQSDEDEFETEDYCEYGEYDEDEDDDDDDDDDDILKDFYL